ncbi:MFS transporter [Arthrobacter sp.]|uniref:MFS transporter n=1 Tax=Arthrobacter sp. TaxID=1667 RepID=UPI002811D445|nr:MFS transporter [Arthrobacter sp.]
MSLAPLLDQLPTKAIRHARLGVNVLFFTNGAIFASLLPRYPEIKADLGLTNAAFGFAIAAFPVGAVLAGLSAGPLVRRFRSSRVAIVATVLSSLGILLAGNAPAWAALAVGLFVAGAMDSITDVAQNSHGLRVQRLYGRSILNSFHAVWSVGAVMGGLLGAAAAGMALPRPLHLSLAAVIFSLMAVLSYRLLLPGQEPAEPAAEGDDRQDRHGVDVKRSGDASGQSMAKYGLLLALVMIASAGALVEDSGSTWSAIYLAGPLEASAFMAGAGFVALQGMQFVGRILGDRMVDRFGQRAVARTGGFIVLLGMGFALMFPTVIGSVIGFGLAGFGVATLIPAAMHAADGLPGFRPGAGLTIVSWLLRLGFLFAPPLVGAIADSSSLRLGLVVVPVAGLLVMVFARVLAPKAMPTD